MFSATGMNSFPARTSKLAVFGMAHLRALRRGRQDRRYSSLVLDHGLKHSNASKRCEVRIARHRIQALAYYVQTLGGARGNAIRPAKFIPERLVIDGALDLPTRSI